MKRVKFDSGNEKLLNQFNPIKLIVLASIFVLSKVQG